MKHFALVLLLFVACKTSNIPTEITEESKYEWKTEESAGYTYNYVTNDPLKARFYTLDNGLTVVLSESDKEPRVSYNMVVRSGSNEDPSDNTGLAHYLEHMLFKGTDKIGGYKWEEEKVLLDEIENLYATYGATTDTQERKRIYEEIDRVSGLAANKAIASEYDFLMSNIGSQSTNAYTWVDQTVYIEDFPSNQMDKFLEVQAERFRNPQMRLFHTELEAVYEEMNGSLDDDGRRAMHKGMEALFPTHNYGLQTTIGTVEHLKSPSITAIKKFYEDNYVPNNMALVLVGDFDSDEVVAKIDKAFGYMKAKPLNKYEGPEQPKFTSPVEINMINKSNAAVAMLYRTPGANAEEVVMLNLISTLLSNQQQAGILDVNAVLNQQLLAAYVSFGPMRDYGAFELYAVPNPDQSLKEVEAVILEQLNLLKQGAFDEDLIQATVANQKLQLQEALQYNDGKISLLNESLVNNHGKLWHQDLAFFDKMSKITKQEVVDFANAFFDDGYVVLYQELGDREPEVVEKPAITPIETVEGEISSFSEAIISREVEPITPQWVKLGEEVSASKVGIADALYVQNKENEIYNFEYTFDFGSNSNNKLLLATRYLDFLGTQEFSAEDKNNELFKLASSIYIDVSSEKTRIFLSGLDQNFEPSLALLDKLLNNCVADELFMEGFLGMMMEERMFLQSDPQEISYRIADYALYGEDNPSNNQLTNDELMQLTGQDLTDIIHSLLKHEHTISYYGPRSEADFLNVVKENHEVPTTWASDLKNVEFEKLKQTENTILFVDNEGVQAEVSWYRTLSDFDALNHPTVNMFNSYFGGGMGSVVFSDIRESKALAYSTYAYVAPPQKADDSYTFTAYVGCQPDKVIQALDAMNALLEDMPKDEIGYETVALNGIDFISSERIPRNEYLSRFERNEALGLGDDYRKSEYDRFSSMTLSEIDNYHASNFSGVPYTIVIVGAKEYMDYDSLSNYGVVKEKTLEEIFGY